MVWSLWNMPLQFLIINHAQAIRAVTLLGAYPRKIKIYTHKKSHSSVHNTPKLDATKMSFHSCRFAILKVLHKETHVLYRIYRIAFGPEVIPLKPIQVVSRVNSTLLLLIYSSPWYKYKSVTF